MILNGSLLVMISKNDVNVGDSLAYSRLYYGQLNEGIKRESAPLCVHDDKNSVTNFIPLYFSIPSSLSSSRNSLFFSVFLLQVVV